MPQCTAITQSWRQCTRNGHHDANGMCQQHHAANAIRWVDAPPHRRRGPLPVFAPQPIPAGAAPAGAALAGAALAGAALAGAALAENPAPVPHADLEALRAARRARTIAENEADIAAALDSTTNRILRIAQRAVMIWSENNLDGWIIPQAYACLRYKSPRVEAFPTLIRAALKFVQLSASHPDGLEFRNIPPAEITARIEEIRGALVAYGNVDLETLVPTSDQNTALFQTRRNREADERRRAEVERRRVAERLEAAAAEIRRLEREAQFQRDLRERPVIFERDPEGSINLRAFGTDRQNIHRSSVQAATQRAVTALMARPLGEGQETLAEITVELTNPERVRWRSSRPDELRERVLLTLTDDYFNLEAFSVAYGDVVDRVWAFARTHEHRNDMITRLSQELSEGLGMCSNGKMAHIVNVLQGYDETAEAPVDTRELFQNAISVLRERPLEDRETAARGLFAEHNIPEAEHNAWLEPLLEA